MRKKIISLVLALAMTVTGAGIGNFSPVSVQAAETTLEDSVITNIPLFKNAYDFRKYVDNADGENAYTVQETITQDWDGVGGVHEFTAPEDGTLVFYTFAEKGHVDGKVYSDFALTSQIGKRASESTREKCGSAAVKKGMKYYFRQERWNGDGEIYATSYLGLIPSSASAACVTPETIYDTNDNVEVKEVNTPEEFENVLPEVTGINLYVPTEWGGYSETHSFTVKHSGWLLSYGYIADGYMDLAVYSDKALGSMISRTHRQQLDEAPEAIWVEPGTYYFRAIRWNGYEVEAPLVAYLGFIDASAYLEASAPVLSADKSSSTVTFKTSTSGNIRVMSGLPEPSIINSDDFWQVSTRANMLSGNTYTATSNGNYVARFQDNATKMYFMVPFTVSGIVKKPGVPTIKSVKNVKGKKAKVTLSGKVSNATGYEVAYATNKKFSSAKTKKFTGTSITLSGLKKKKTYYVHVRAYNSAGNGSWSGTKKVKIKK